MNLSSLDDDIKKLHVSEFDIFCIVLRLVYSRTRFFINNNYTGDTSIKLLKNQDNAEQHPEVGFLTFESYSPATSALSIKNNGSHSKK